MMRPRNNLSRREFVSGAVAAAAAACLSAPAFSRGFASHHHTTHSAQSNRGGKIRGLLEVPSGLRFGNDGSLGRLS